MGVGIYDYWSAGHFLGGYLSRAVIFPNNPLLSLIISNVVHLLIELNEVNISSDTKVEYESTKNHISDCVFFLVGWIISHVVIQKYNVRFTKPVYITLSILLFGGFAKEIIEELDGVSSSIKKI